jgi:hypothetical protein
MKVDKHDIKLQCRWSTDRANGVRTVQRSMIHNYLEVRNMQQALIRPSKACWPGPVIWTQSTQTWQTMGSGICLRWDDSGGAFPFLLEGILPIFLGRHCSEPSPWLILFGLMSIRLNLDLSNYAFLRLQDPRGIAPLWISLRGRSFGCETPTHTFWSSYTRITK